MTTLPDSFGSSSDRLLLAVLAAAVLHALLIFGIRFQLPRPAPVKRNLDIELVQQPNRERPKKADYRAAHDSQGGAPRKARPKPLPKALPSGHPRSAANQSQDKKAVLTAARADMAVASKSKQPQNRPRLNPGILARQIAELGQVAKRPVLFGSQRVTPIHQIRAHRYIAAAYERAWQDKVERIGNLNYPDEARRKGMSGRLLMSVWVAKDGTVRKIEIHRSSGHKVLDAAAMRIVRLAAPFAPFPKELAAQTDILVITRTWNFYNEAGLAMGR